ncbi:MAG TPA: site-specific integrase [Verrucomicrobiae bacterium]|jgi:integrase|nr:site-specific integrase [Verrucomicrobiae bacterium]
MKTAKDGKQFPVTITEGGVSAKIRKTSQTKNGTDYVVYIVDYILFGKRKQVGRSSFDEAKQHALEACRSISQGRQDSFTLTNQDRLVYLRATESLAPVGFQLDVAATEYAAAMQILGGKTSIAEACRDWMKRNATECPKVNLPDAIKLFKSEAETDNKSEERKKQFRIVLNRFAESFNDEAHTVTPGLISSHLTNLPLSDRSKKNHRDVIGCFNRWLILKGYLPKGTNWLENVQRYSGKRYSEIEIFTPEELTKLLQVAGEMTPFVAIAAFAGLRHAEIGRLDWSEIDLEDGFIEVKAIKSKTGERRLVPIHDNLKKWLLNYRKDSGKVISYANTNKQIAKIARHAGIKWKHNALRHSFISYRVAECADVPRVADEAGNSPQMIRQHYLRRVKPALADQWFNVVPATPTNVVALPATQPVAA